MPCYSPPVSVLNGACSNSEGGRLSRMMKGCCYKGNTTSFPVDTPSCNPSYLSTINKPVITQPESSRVSAICNVRASSRLTQDYVKQLLSKATVTNYSSEDARVSAVQQGAINCGNSDPFSLRIPPTDFTCIPTPPPPGPPARICVLTKNQKF
jgi:hypothetical protein